MRFRIALCSMVFVLALGPTVAAQGFGRGYLRPSEPPPSRPRVSAVQSPPIDEGIASNISSRAIIALLALTVVMVLRTGMRARDLLRERVSDLENADRTELPRL